MNSAPNTDSELDTATLSTREPGPTIPGREFPKLFADIVCEQARQLSLPVFKYTVKKSLQSRSTICSQLDQSELSVQHAKLGAVRLQVCFLLLLLL